MRHSFKDKKDGPWQNVVLDGDSIKLEEGNEILKSIPVSEIQTIKVDIPMLKVITVEVKSVS